MITNPITGAQTPVFGPKTAVSGFRLVDARASYGLGLETFLLGFPVHFDWAWKTLLNKDYEDVLFAAQGGSAAFRKPKFALWIGYDFNTLQVGQKAEDRLRPFPFFFLLRQ